MATLDAKQRTELLDLLVAVAEVPSFSSFEDRLHPLIEDVVSTITSAEVRYVEDNNVIIQLPGRAGDTPVALAAHLDKINHFGPDPPERLPVSLAEDRVVGQLDDAVGVALCLYLLLRSNEVSFRPFCLLFSEMEESYGLRRHPELLRNQGAGLCPQIGAERIARHLIDNDMVPDSVITIDTTPLFRGDRGIAVYDAFWEECGFDPPQELLSQTRNLTAEVFEAESGIHAANNLNDYIAYGRTLNRHSGSPVPSIALEPAIHPYHQEGEMVFYEDILRVYSILHRFLAALSL